MKTGESIAEPLRLLGALGKGGMKDRGSEPIGTVGLSQSFFYVDNAELIRTLLPLPIHDLLNHDSNPEPINDSGSPSGQCPRAELTRGFSYPPCP